MQRKFYSLLIDRIFLIVSTFLISFVWIRYNVHNNFLIFLYTSLITVFVCIVFHIIYKKRVKKSEFNKKNRKNIENLTNLFTFQTKTETLSYFKKALENKNLVAKIENDFITFNNSILTVCYYTICCNASDIINIIVNAKTKNFKSKNLIICAKCFNDEVFKLIKNVDCFNIILLDENEIYYKLFNNFQTEKVIVKKQKKVYI